MSKEAQIYEFLKELIIEMKDCDEDSLRPDMGFEELELNSLDYVEVQVAVKKHYGVDLVPDLFASGTLSNLQQLAAFIEGESSVAAE